MLPQIDSTRADSASELTQIATGRMLHRVKTESREYVSLDPLWSMLLAVGGFLGGLGLMLIGAWSTRRSETFTDSYSGRLWIVLIAGQTAFWAVIAIPLWSGLRAFYDAFRRELHGSWVRATLFACIFLALLFAAPRLALPDIQNPLHGHTWKITTLSTANAFAIVIPALVAMFWVRIVASTLEPQDEDSGEGTRYVFLRESLQRVLRLVGALIALSTLSTGALRQAVIANGYGGDTFPPEIVLLWGAGATVLVLLAYVPAYLSLRAAGRRFVAQLLPMPRIGTDDWFAWDSKRRTLIDFLQLEQNLADRLQASLFIVAPLLSAAISLAIPRQS